ncbi:MAG TPA: glycosyltransferase family 2 protein, partial [Xanthobacteraceae bacterium]
MSSPPSAPPGAASAKKPGDPPRAPIVRLDRWRGAVQILSLGGGLIEHGLTLRVDHQAVASIDLARAHDVATAGFNLLANPDFSQFSALWKPEVPGDGASACGLDLAPEWTLQGSHTAFLGTFVGPPQGRGRLCYVDPFYGAWLPISDKQRYLFRARVGTHRCTAHLSAELRNAAGEIRLIAGPPLDAARAGGRTLAGYHDAQLEIAPRAGESALRLSIAKSDTIEGADSFLFLAHPAFGLKPKSEHFSIPNAAVDEVLRGTIIGLVAAGKPVNVVTVPLPKDCYDGREHTIEVIGPHGEPLAAPQAFQRADASYGQIESFDGFELRGSVPTKPNQVIGRLQLRIDEDVVETVSVLDQTRDRIAFTAKIPPRYLDGRPHLFVVLGPANHPLAAAAGLTACHLTPWADLEAHASLPLPAARSPRAMSHLENLDRLHRAYARACQDKTTAKLSALRHRLHEAALAHAELGLPWERRRIFPKLAFPAVRSPTVSVVIPCHNNWKATYHCLTALKFAHSEATFEVIIVDDGSTDETATLEAMVKGVKVVRNASALGFVHACNRGAAAARGRFIAFLNNDTEVTGRWLDEMALLFETYPSVGLVGSKLLFPDGRLQEAGGVVWQSGNPTNYGRLENPEDPRFCYVRQIDYASGASIMVDRAVWKTVGGFSEIFAPAYFEDTDLAFKIRAAGYATLYAPHSVVYHFEGLSSGPATSGGMKRFQEVNRPKFKQTWARAYRSAGIEGENIDLEKDRNIARRCLMIDYQIPRPDLDAGSYAAIQEIRLLQSLGYKVTFLPQNTLYLGGYVSLLQRLGVEVVYAPFALGVAEFLSRRGAEFDLIYITRYAVARAVIDDAREHSPRAKIVLNVADLHFLRELRAALPARQPDEMRRVELIREEELDAIRRVDLAL